MRRINRSTLSPPTCIQGPGRRRARVIGVLSLGLWMVPAPRATAATASAPLTVSAIADEAYALIIGDEAAAVNSGSPVGNISVTRTLNLDAPIGGQGPISVTVKARVAAQTR